MAFLKKRGGKKHARPLRTRLKRVAEEHLRRLEHGLSQRQLGQQTDTALHQLQEECVLYSKATKKQSSDGPHDVPRVGRFIEYLHGHGVEKASQMTQARVEDYQQHLP